MVLQAFCDESVSRSHFVIAGYIASSEEWAEFSQEWDWLLKTYGIRDRRASAFHFKMNKMWSLKRDNIERFFRLIEKHVRMSVSCAIRFGDWELAKRRVFLNHPDFNIGDLSALRSHDNIYLHAFRSLMDVFHSIRLDERLQNLLSNEKIDFYFDEKGEKNIIRKSWDGYVKNRDAEYRLFYGKQPHFGDDRDFLPLQAADFIAWWIRKWHDIAYHDTRVILGDFCIFDRKKAMPGIHVQVTEDMIAAQFQRVLKDFARGPFKAIYDVKFQQLCSSPKDIVFV